MNQVNILEYGEILKRMITFIRNFRNVHKIKSKIEIYIPNELHILELLIAKHCNATVYYIDDNIPENAIPFNIN